MHGTIEVYVIWSIIDDICIGTVGDFQKAHEMVQDEIQEQLERHKAHRTKYDYRIIQSDLEF